MKTCNDCQYAIMKDYGYSNWTVEGTTFICSRGLHPEGSFDRFYGENPRLEFAKQCEGYEQGTPANLDVDGEWRTDGMTKEHPAMKMIEVTEMLTGKDLSKNL